MAIANEAVALLSTLVIGIGGFFAVWGIVNLLQAWGNENPAQTNQGIKQLGAGIGLIIAGGGLVLSLMGAFG